MSLAGCQIILIDLNFHLQKCLEIFDKNSADKVQANKDKGRKVRSLMPIRVKPRTSSLGTIVLSYNSLPERQCDGNFDFLQIFQPIKAQVDL